MEGWPPTRWRRTGQLRSTSGFGMRKAYDAILARCDRHAPLFSVPLFVQSRVSLCMESATLQGARYRAHDAWVELKALHLAVFILLPIGGSAFQQLQPRHTSDYAIGVEDRVDERIGRNRQAVLE